MLSTTEMFYIICLSFKINITNNINEFKFSNKVTQYMNAVLFIKLRYYINI